jgi:hypothetical protein
MTKRLWVALVMALSFSAVAQAETTDMAHAGAWTTFGGTDDAHHEVCGMSTDINGGGFFGIKRYEGRKYLSVQIIKSQWTFHGGDVDTSFTMGDNDPWTAKGSTSEGGHMIEFTVPSLRIKDFISQFMGSAKAVLVMGHGQTVTWNLDLVGTGRVTKAFNDCLDQMQN